MDTQKQTKRQPKVTKKQLAAQQRAKEMKALLSLVRETSIYLSHSTGPKAEFDALQARLSSAGKWAILQLKEAR